MPKNGFRGCSRGGGVRARRTEFGVGPLETCWGQGRARLVLSGRLRSDLRVRSGPAASLISSRPGAGGCPVEVEDGGTRWSGYLPSRARRPLPPSTPRCAALRSALHDLTSPGGADARQEPAAPRRPSGGRRPASWAMRCRRAARHPLVAQHRRQLIARHCCAMDRPRVDRPVRGEERVAMPAKRRPATVDARRSPGRARS